MLVKVEIKVPHGTTFIAVDDSQLVYHRKNAAMVVDYAHYTCKAFGRECEVCQILFIEKAKTSR